VRDGNRHTHNFFVSQKHLGREKNAGIIDIVRNLGSEITVLIVRYDTEMVFEAAEQAIVLHHGQIIADRTPAEIEADRRVREIYMGLEQIE